ncbi:DUF6415 family natural product biosynthesis protein [Streptomyces chartreusis]|uniref:DUF6415 family natural product biosynthesis protein n=1 Tax=Streptomyces chartreusis TaxID=1969 RepID=UPI003D8BDA79
MPNGTGERSLGVKQPQRVYTVDRYGSASSTTPPPTTVRLRASASWFLAQKTLPTYGVVKAFDAEFRQALTELMPQIEQHAAQRPEDDVPARAAMAGVGEAARRLGLPERPGLQGEYERVTRLARSAIALCDHLDSFTGRRMCLACDRPIADGQPSMSYDKVSPSGGALTPGRIHSACAAAGRPRR